MTIDKTTKKNIQHSPEPGDLLTFNISNEIEIQFSWLPAGNFLMGSSEKEQSHEAEESPRHNVRFDQGFNMGRFTVTDRQLNAVISKAHPQTIFL